VRAPSLPVPGWHAANRLLRAAHARMPRRRQVEGAFSQPNSGIAAQMLAWAQDVTRGSEGHDLLGAATLC
jgi:tRNA/tmRNA/rRNA uracil-C5-methylase (TrmA/RlmC/RlmD family)